MSDYLNRLKPILKVLDKMRYKERYQITDIWIAKGDYKYSETCTQCYEKRQEQGFTKFLKNHVWGGTDSHYWFLTRLEIPKSYEGEPLVLELNTGATDIWNTDNPQIMVFVNQQLFGTMDMNHYRMTIKDKCEAGEQIELAFYAYSNSASLTNFFILEQAKLDRQIEGLYYDLKVPYEAVMECRDEELVRYQILEVLNQALNLLDLRQPDSLAFIESVVRCREFLKDALYSGKRLGHEDSMPVTVHSIGHTHIDVAWKWPVKQTRQKVVRSFASVIRLMEEFPEYRFMSSQPQLYQFVKDDAPKLYEKIKERIHEGRWEVEGGMWLEADCNLASGESLIRHILYGRRFFKEEFGVEEQKVLWLPDVFGYCIALPQIMQKSGMDYFMTTKLGWNEYNKMPHDLFTWQGNDGSKVLTYFITTIDYKKYPELERKPLYNTTYNGLQNPSQIKGTWQRFQDKKICRDVLTCYGHGDGGGGPTEEMLHQDLRLKYGVAGCPKTKQTFVGEFFDQVARTTPEEKLPKWCGELYLESHRGTYTSVAKNKRNNRKAEILMNDVEFLNAMLARKEKGPVITKDRIESLWKVILLNQFHDILPGSSIAEVYETTDKDYAEVFEKGKQLCLEAIVKLIEAKSVKTDCDVVQVSVEAEGTSDADDEGIVVMNNLSFERQELIEIDKEVVLPSTFSIQKLRSGNQLALTPKLKSKSLLTYGVQREPSNDDVTSPTEVLIQHIVSDESGSLNFETPFYRVSFDKNGEIIHLWDLEAEREVVAPSVSLNRLMAYEDRPASFDAWNIDAFYCEKAWHINEVMEMKIEENGPILGCVKIRKQFLDSHIEQRICFYQHSRRIDIRTMIDWQQHQVLLKALFDVDIRSHRANFDVQFGQVERANHRNTSWEEGKFEVCAHKWMDLSEANYGVAVLNDCKYGHHVHENQLGLTLIKSGIFPDPMADIGHHEFTYSLLPHQGDYRAGHVVQESLCLNQPVITWFMTGNPNVSKSYVHLDSENVIIETIKTAEDGQGSILRLYETYGATVKATLSFVDMPITKAWMCDMMENINHEVPIISHKIEIKIKPYEIVTLRVEH